MASYRINSLVGEWQALCAHRAGVLGNPRWYALDMANEDRWWRWLEQEGEGLAHRTGSSESTVDIYVITYILNA